MDISILGLYCWALSCYLWTRTCTMLLLSYRNSLVEVWENEKCCRNTSCRWLFPQLVFEFSQTFMCVFYNSLETQRTSWCFLFLLENTTVKTRETTCLLWSSKYEFSLLTLSLGQQFLLVLCFFRVIETRFLTNQQAYFLRNIF